MKAFDCKMCGECCYGEGGIFMEAHEQRRIAQYMGLAFEDFLAQYTVERNGRTYAAVGPDGFCIFFQKEKGCTVHTVKPARCELWPYFPANVKDPETWVLAKEACPGISRECSFEDFVKSSTDSGTNEK